MKNVAENGALVLAIAVVIGLGTNAWAQGVEDDEELEFEEAEVFFELNNTDGDLGIHALVDGGPWKRLEIRDYNDREILDVWVRRRLRAQGLTEIFFESAEPTFDELTPEDFFLRFKEGTYEVGGKSLDGEELENEVDVTHLMPAPAEPTVNGEVMADNCDDEDPGYNPTELVEGDPVVIAWPPITMSHPDLGSPRSSPDITIHNYEIVVETDLELEPEEEFTAIFSAIVPPDVNSMVIPPEFLALNDTFKYEVLGRESSYNQTAVESCFVITEAP